MAWDLNMGLPEYEAVVLATWPQCLVYFLSQASLQFGKICKLLNVFDF
jgi:hypothetical protein